MVATREERDPYAHLSIPDRVYINQLRDLYEMQKHMKEVAERIAKEARGHLVDVAIAMCPGELDAAVKADPRGFEDWPLERFARLIIGEYRRMECEFEWLRQEADGDLVEQNRLAGEKIVELSKRLAQAQRQIEEHEAARREAERVLEQANQETGVLKQTVADLQARLAQATAADRPAPSVRPAPVVRSAPSDERFRRWCESPAFDTDSQIVLAMGRTGECRRKNLTDEIVSLAGTRVSASGMGRGFGRLADEGLIEIIQIKPRVSGSASNLVRLTEKGQGTYRGLVGQEPRSCLLDEMLARHRSPEHAYLNLEAADMLEQAGYRVDRFPPEMTLSGGEKFVPDLRATSAEGETVWVEVERDTRKNSDSWERKWDIYHEATGGKFHIVTANRSEMREIASKIEYWAGERLVCFWMTNISDVWGGERGRDGSIWLIRQEY